MVSLQVNFSTETDEKLHLCTRHKHTGSLMDRGTHRGIRSAFHFEAGQAPGQLAVSHKLCCVSQRESILGVVFLCTLDARSAPRKLIPLSLLVRLCDSECTERGSELMNSFFSLFFFRGEAGG